MEPAAGGKKQRNIRKRRALDEQEALSDGDAEGQGLSAEDIRLLQKQRQRRAGVDAVDLALANEYIVTEDAGPATVKEGLSAAFKKERRLDAEDDDPHMKQYIEEQLERRMGKQQQPDDGGGKGGAAGGGGPGGGGDDLLGGPLREEEAEMAPSWVNGILEVPLSLEAKLKNIEDTEAAKKALLAKGGLALEEDGDGGGPGLRRGMYPVNFGRQDPKAQERIQESQARKRATREHFWEKRQQQAQQFKGW